MTATASVIPDLAAARAWSAQQEAVFAWFEDVTRLRAVVRARAGTGKTTTIIEGINRAPEQRILLCAFNKKIAEELQRRIANPRAEAKTLHALGNAIVKRNWEDVRIDSERGRRLAKVAAGGDSAPDAMVSLVAKLATLGKEMVPFAKDSTALHGVAEDMDCVPDDEWQEEGWTLARVAQCAFRAMGLACKRDGTIDFSDMLFLPLRHKWVSGRFELVVVDECQDMNAAQLYLALKLVKEGGRLIVVGDDRQAIYRFRGADSDSMDRIKKAMNAEELPLNITYRCPKAVVAEAQRLVPDFQAAATAPEGVVSALPIAKLAETAQPGDAILSRKNAPLVRVCLSILRRGVRAKVEGKDVGAGLVALVKKLKAKSMPEFLTKLTKWEEKETARAQALGGEKAERKVGEVQDKAETLKALAEGLTGVKELEARITDLFSDDTGKRDDVVVCSSVHRSKGLEWKRVFVLWETLLSKAGGQGEEENIEYVAITRAKHELVKVEGKNW